MKIKLFYCVSLWFLFFCVTSFNLQASEYDIGVYYFPGWKDNAIGGPYPNPWGKIKPYPERKPILGWYREGDVSIMDKQLGWMADSGINYVVFDWLWASNNKGYLEHAIDAYGYAKNRKRVSFAVLWANHTDYIFSKGQLTALIKYWCDRFFKKNEYKRLNDRPVVFIFSARVLNNNLQKIGMTSAEFFKYADNIAKARGFKGISFIAGTGAADPQIDYSQASGYSGFSAYNYHSPATYRLPNNSSNMSHSYLELDHAYQDHWAWLLTHSSGILILPLTSGWSKTPWGGSADPMHDNSIGTPIEFEHHLLAAKKVLDTHPDKTKKMAVICCWNEYGEGSFIEPHSKYGFAYLEKIHAVFASEKK